MSESLGFYERNPFAYIDKKVYINLDRREDRKKEFEEQMKRANIEVERFSAVSNLHPDVGCGTSHVTVLKQAIGRKNVLIFEDDFNFDDNIDKVNQCLSQFFRYTDNKSDSGDADNSSSTGNSISTGNSGDSGNWDVLMLHATFVTSYTNNDGILRISGAQSGACYLVNGHYIEKLALHIEEGVKKLAETGEHWKYMNDVYWKLLQVTDRWYAFEHNIGYQRKSYSDLAHKVVEHR